MRRKPHFLFTPPQNPIVITMRLKIILFFLIAFTPQFAHASCIEGGGGSATCTNQNEAAVWVHDISHQLVACDNMAPVTNRYEAFVPSSNPGYYYVGLDCGSPFYQRYISASFVEPIPNPDPEKDLGGICPVCSSDPNKLFGDPINIATGNEFLTENDFKTSRLLEFTRYYNSDKSASTHLQGPQWTNTYSRRIDYSPTASTIAKVLRPDGQKITFNLVAGVWTPDADVVAKLQRIDDVGGQLLGWTFKGRDDREIEDFDAKGRVIGITRNDGQSVVVIYNNGLTENNDNDFLLTSVVAQDGRKIRFEYDTSRRISKIINADGAEYLYNYYSTSGLLASAIYPDGSYTTHAYNEAGYTSHSNLPNALTGLIDGKGQRYGTISYSVDGRALSSERGGGVEKFSIDYYTNDASVTVTHPNGAQEQHTFATLFDVKKATGISVNAGSVIRNLSYTYDSYGRADIVTDFAGTTTDNDYNARSLLTQRIESANQAATKRTTQTDWHAIFNAPTESRVLNASNVLEAKTKYAYNARGQATAMCQIDPSNSTAMAYVCGSATNAPVGVRQSTTIYCEAADVTAGTCPMIGLAISSNGPRTDVSDITTFSYYQTDDATCVTAPTTCTHRKGDLWKVTNALNQVLEYTSYDGAGRVLQMKYANNVIADMEYHPRGWLTARKVRGIDNASEADDVITRLDYDAAGQVSKVTQPDGDFVVFNYDSAHRLTGISDALNNSITYTLDNTGNHTVETTNDPNNVAKLSLNRAFDSLGRLQASKNAVGTVLFTPTYDTNNNPNTITDGLSRVTDRDVDPLNRLIKTIQDQGVGKINATTQFIYDARDNLRTVTDPKGLSTTYTYNGLNDLTALVSPDTGSTSYTYDSAGNRKTKTDAKLVVSNYSYDVLNRLTQISYPSATTLSSNFIYDSVNTICGATENFAKGRLTKFTDPSGDTQYCYDRFGNVTRKQITNNSLVSTFVFAYTKAGRINSITYPSGMVVNYVYNSIGQATQVNVTQGTTTTTLVNDVAYLPMGPIKQLSFPVPAGGTATSALTQTRNYDNNYTIQSIGGLNYTVDVQGNIKAIVDAAGGNNFDYDNLDRLTKVKDSSTLADITAFTYDATGNRLSKKVGAAAAVNNTYPASSHRLTQVGTVARTLDANGNSTKTATTKIFTYDARNRMVDFRTGSANSTIVSQYQFNAKGERVRKYKGTIDQARYQYSESGQLLVESRIVGGVTTTQEIIWLGNMPIGINQNGTLHGILTDHLNSPRDVFELATQKTVWRWNMADDAFGENLASEDPDANAVLFKFDMRFPGQLFDSESGLHYNYYRDYEPSTGRYVESDPIGLSGGASTFGYAGGNPKGGRDVFGLSSEVIPLGSDSIEWGRMLRGLIPIVSPAAVTLIVGGAALLYPSEIGAAPCELNGTSCTTDPRPHGLKGKQEGIYDKICKSAPDKCAALKLATMARIQEAIGKIGSMKNDASLGNLYVDAYSTVNPSKPDMGTWLGHKEDLNNTINLINEMIALGKLMGCDMSDEYKLSLALYLPFMPGY